MTNKKNTELVGIDLFAGAGGMSLGANLAGVDVRIAVEMDPYAAETYKSNHPGTQLILSDIRKVTGLPRMNKNKKVVLFGGPPCQGFSTSNQRTRDFLNSENWLFREYLRMVTEVAPDYVLFENVQGILETEGGVFFRQMKEGLERRGYETSHGTLNSSHFGVPQKRNRLFLIGSRNGKKVILPKAANVPIPSVSDALGDLPRLENGSCLEWLPYRRKSPSQYATKLRGKLKGTTNHLITRNSPIVLNRYKFVPQGGNWEDIPHRLMKSYKDRTRCHTGIYYRLKSNEPSIVIGNFRKNMLIHPVENRGLSVREAARIQSFPDWYDFKGSIGFQQQQVGNAVPPLLAKAVFSAIRNQIT